MLQSEQTDGPKAEAPEAVQANVKHWTKKIRAARAKFLDDFKRIRENMRFAAGKQWDEQSQINTDKYVCNLTLRNVNQKVASLYARNPQVKATPRKRMEYTVWNGKIESLVSAISSLAMDPMDLEARAIIADFEQGQTRKELLARICSTLEILYTWNLDQQEPEFKKQMKQLVRRAIICGVAYVRMSFIRDGHKQAPTETDTDTLLMGRAKKAVEIMKRIDDGEVDRTDADIEQLRILFSGFGVATSSEADATVHERLLLDFPSATSLIPDPCCRSLKDFVGAGWIALEYVLDLEDINAFFGTEIDETSQEYTSEGLDLSETTRKLDDTKTQRYACLWEVFDRRTKTRFFIVDGHKDYVMVPEVVEPETKRFWPIFTLSFNDIEPDEEAKVTIFPPSDVQLMKHSQKEWNRSREALREHRRQNRPKYLAVKGRLTEEDKNKLANVPQSGVIEVEGVGAGEDVAKLVTPFQHAALDPALYDTAWLQQDVLLSVGAQEANLGPLSGATATESTIAEQSRMSTSSSNVDDLDDLLSDLARAGGEVLMREASIETVKRVCGPGATWPTLVDDFVNEILLEVVAASSGRPNKATEIANFERLYPALIAAGVPPTFIAQEAIKRLDDRISLEDVLPLIPRQPMMMPQPMGAQQALAYGGGGGQQGQEQAQPPHVLHGAQQPLQPLPSGATAPPLVAA